MNTLALATNEYTVKPVRQTEQRWYFSQLQAFDADGVISVTGKMTASTRYALPGGHIDIAAYTADGKLLEETTTTYTPSILTEHIKRKGGVRFSARLTKTLPAGSIIKVAFHEEKVNQPEPQHENTVAK